ncbi:MAG: hypothetical protein U0X91_04780 [Spirosomataceae bacterium]
MKLFTLPYLGKTTGFTLFFLLLFHIARSQVTLTLDYKVKAPSPSSVKSGEYRAMQPDYTISGTTAPNTARAKIRIPLPDLIENLTGFVGTSHAPANNFVFTNTPRAKKLTINFINSVPTGANGILELQLQTTKDAIPAIAPKNNA